MSIHLLLIEDNPADALFLQKALKAHYPGKYATMLAATLGKARSLLAHTEFDAALLDLSLPDSRGLATIERLAAAEPKLPIVVLSGVDDARIVPEAVRCGRRIICSKAGATARLSPAQSSTPWTANGSRRNFAKHATIWKRACGSEPGNWPVPTPNCGKPRKRRRRQARRRALSWPT